MGSGAGRFRPGSFAPPRSHHQDDFQRRLGLLSNVFRSGVTSLVKSLSFQVARDNIRINNLVPGFFDTDRLKELDLRNSREWRISLENVREINFDKIPMGRYGNPDELFSTL